MEKLIQEMEALWAHMANDSTVPYRYAERWKELIDELKGRTV
jgi:hypothetical protein